MKKADKSVCRQLTNGVFYLVYVCVRQKNAYSATEAKFRRRIDRQAGDFF